MKKDVMKILEYFFFFHKKKKKSVVLFGVVDATNCCENRV